MTFPCLNFWKFWVVYLLEIHYNPLGEATNCHTQKTWLIKFLSWNIPGCLGPHWVNGSEHKSGASFFFPSADYKETIVKFHILQPTLWHPMAMLARASLPLAKMMVRDSPTTSKDDGVGLLMFMQSPLWIFLSSWGIKHQLPSHHHLSSHEPLKTNK